jgi:hypothetical protein
MVKQLKDCTDHDVRNALAGRNLVTIEEQKQLLDIDFNEAFVDDSALRALAGNPELTEEIQTQLMSATVLSGGSRLSRMLDRQTSGINKQDIRIALAANSGLTHTHQCALAEDEDEGVRIALAGNPALVAEAQLKLTTYYSNNLLRKQVRSNDYDTYEEMETQYSAIRSILAQHPALIESIQRQFELDTDKTNESCKEYHSEEFSKPIETRLALAGNPALIPDIQLKMA